MKLCALSVDLDEIPCYHAIHGLPMPAGDPARAVYAKAVPRYRELLSAMGVPGTFFVIGHDLDDPVAFEGAKALAADGHELGNHTQNHRYDLTRLDADAMRAEVHDGMYSIAKVQGFPPSGFRAPGYTVNDRLLDILSEQGVFYDSSVFPCPTYWSAKAVALGVIQLRGRQSRSILDTPSVLASPADPYVPGRPYWQKTQKDSALLELPIGVTRLLRLPYIGTYLAMAGVKGAALLTAQIAGRPLVNLELHGIDLLDEHDGLGALRPHQPDVRVPVERKLAVLRSVIEDLSRRGYTFVTLKDAARMFSDVLQPPRAG